MLRTSASRVLALSAQVKHPWGGIYTLGYVCAWLLLYSDRFLFGQDKLHTKFVFKKPRTLKIKDFTTF